MTIQVHNDLNNLPVFKKAVITIGTFDGVHLGHQQIIQQMKDEATAIGGETIIITFHPHPRNVIAGNSKDIKILNTLTEKIELLNRIGVEHLVVIPFTDAFANQSAEDYIQHFLVQKFHPHTIIIGYDHRFGNGRSGDYHLLEKLGVVFNYKVKEINEKILDEVTISSTRVREAVLKSDIATANNYLGYDYFFEGSVVTGNKMGRTIDYPTANLLMEDEEKLVPGNGVYAVNAMVKNNTTILKGMMNIGVRPTVDGTARTIEVHIFDFNQNIYGEKLRVYVKHYLRGEKKFNGLDSLKQQLAIDKTEAINSLK